MAPYSAVPYEEKWSRRFIEDRIFEADPSPDRPKLFVTFPYSYQNGPLHVGHGFTASRVDMYARYKRMRGYNVLFPWAWHWTGEAVAGTAERLRRGDPNVLRMLREVDKVPEELVERFRDPAFISQYYTGENREVVKLIGFSVDWRREFYTSDLHPYYSRFVEWQYRTLHGLGRLRKGSHPVVWCPACESPTGDHDRLVGEGVSPIEFTLVYFRIEGGNSYLAASTLRPETIFGATNVWVKPEAEYLEARLGGVELVVSREALLKLREQHRGLAETGKAFRGAELVGKYCVAPLTGKRLVVLPARFVDPDLGTGVVYSVPSHAPYDYAGLKELKGSPEILREYGLLETELAGLEPISIITTPGLPKHPAVEAVEGEGIESSTDARLERLTQKLYADEFYGGVLNELCGEYMGLQVRRARDEVKSRLISAGLGSTMYDLPQPVICRSGDKCIVKVVEDQWFVTYGDEDWKERVREHVSRGMNIYPEGARQWFLNVIDWLGDWPCTRKTGLGTRFPYDPSWIVETLSDSTVYQALYTISKFLNSGRVRPEQLTDQLLDYIFRSVGKVDEVALETGLEPKTIEEMRSEFSYWYPVDLRVSAKELLPNHLTFYIFQHIALFPPEKWPRAVAVNGMVRVEGEEMHKSRGVFVSLKEAIARVGADATRLAILLSAEDMDDPDWKWRNAENMRRHLDGFLKLIEEYSSLRLDEEWEEADGWALSRLAQVVSEVESSLEVLKTRTAASKILYETENLWRKYLRRRGGRPGPAAKTIIESWIKMLSIVAPYTAEEAWSTLGYNGYACLSSWPSPQGPPESEDLLLRGEVLENVLEDARDIIHTTRRRPSKVYLYVARREMIQLLRVAAGVWGDLAQKGSSFLIAELAGIGGLEKGKLPAIAKRFFEVVRDYSQRYRVDTIVRVASQEYELYTSNMRYIESELGCRILVARADEAYHDPLRKAETAVPLRPGIYAE